MPKPAHYEVKFKGTEEERYKGALAVALNEIALIRESRQWHDDEVEYKEEKKIPVNKVSSQVTLTSKSTSWTVDIAPADAEDDSKKYTYDHSSGQVMLHQPGNQEGTVIPGNGEGADKLEELHAILFDFN